jgi:hypothetical protein
MPDHDHPPWCHQRRCTANAPPVNGHPTAMHRSAPEASGLTEAYLVQTPAAAVPSVQVCRDGARVTLPIGEAQGLAPAVGDLLRQAGVGP